MIMISFHPYMIVFQWINDYSRKDTSLDIMVIMTVE